MKFPCPCFIPIPVIYTPFRPFDMTRRNSDANGKGETNDPAWAVGQAVAL